MRIFKSLLLSALTVMLAVSCNEGLRIDNADKAASIGYLQLSALSVECVADRKPTNGGVETRSSLAEATTVAEQVDINTFDCIIYDKSGTNQIMSFKYGERPSQKIELEAGNYILKMISGEIQGAAFESPVYGLTEPFTIVRAQTTTLTDLVCTLQNIQASVSYAADLRAALSDDTTATLTVGCSSLVYGIDDQRMGHFKAEKALNDIVITVEGKYTPEGKTEASPIVFNYTIKDVKAGQYSDIMLYQEYSGEGSISIGVTIDGWIVDQQVVFDISSLIAEDTIVDDDDKPQVELVGGNIDNAVVLSAADFDAAGNCTKSVIVDITTTAAIASLELEISSTNSEFIASLSEYNIPQSFDLCNAGTAAASLRLMGLPVNGDVLGKTSATYDITAQMKLLKEFDGSHSFRFTVTDEQGASTEKTLTITFGNGPSIVWVGYDIDQQYTVVDGMTVDIIVSAPAGINAFTVKIESNVLTPDQLGGVDLCDVLNLVEPENSYSTVDPSFNTANIATTLTNFGFPIGDEVRNKTEVKFSITDFLELLSFTGAGEHNFVMTVTDNDGNSIVKTLMIVTQ